MKNEPTNGELKIMLDNLIANSDQRHLDYKETHKEVLLTLTALVSQVKIANGRTAKLEWWKNLIVWGMGAIWTMIVIAVPLVWKILDTQIDIRVQQGINSKLIDNVTK